LISILGLKDELRPFCPEILSEISDAQFNVRMVTGDNLNNAINFAK